MVTVVQQNLYKYNYKSDIDKYECCRITIKSTGGKRNTIHCTNMYIKKQDTFPSKNAENKGVAGKRRVDLKKI